MVAIEHNYKGYEIHIFVRQFLDTDQWTFSASVFGHAGDPEMIKRMHYRGRLATKEEAEKKAIGIVRKWIDDRMPDVSGSMDRTKARQRIRESLKSGHLPNGFNLTSFAIGHPPYRETCAGCDELFSLDEKTAIVHTKTGKDYWFHEDCEKIWQEERHRIIPRS
jgi:hypothetical protein